ncbi:DUF11 domain-containing protein [Sphingobacterium lumbrici]|uniref:DUF11 domain-containing protein n=1 Tax=Sphingobacterium lumbrici TaxID=2559600 RepID=UPI00112DFE93|nr:DUF11 domain-containing protein [Sphingobacterium lumbrici]
MKTLIEIKSYSLLLLFMVLSVVSRGQIVLNTAPQTASCNIGSYGVMTISVPAEALTGDNIPLNITLPGTMSASCVKTVTVNTSSNLQFQVSGAIPFTMTAPQTYQNTTPLAGNDGQNFNLFFKFPGYVTCDGVEGSFQVTVKVECGGQEYICNSTVKVKARAANYWSVQKVFVSGNLVCGISHWRIYLQHNNPNGIGLGTYSIQGTMTEDAPTPVVSGAFFNVGPIHSAGNGGYVYDVYLNNCVSEGATITNNVDYQFQLGNGCGNMDGTATATSSAMSSPNASLSFTKQVYNGAGTNLTPGCQGRYLIVLTNNGNVPWTDITVTDNLNIPGITLVGTPTVPGGWTVTNVAGFYTFSGGSTQLNPGQTVYIWITFTIDSTTPVGSTIINTAQVSYQAIGSGSGSSGGGSSSTACPGIDCPQLDTAIQNQTANTQFVVEEPRPIPAIRKCIINPPNALTPPLYQIGNTIQFVVTIWNSGAGDLSTVVSDALAAMGQNLQIIPSSIQYEYYTNGNTGYINSCMPPAGHLQPSVPFPVTANTSDLQNPTFTITNMPGICQIGMGNFLRIYFDAKILPQMHGSKTNLANITYNGSSLSSAVNYAVDQVGVLSVKKQADQDIVENGQMFNYIIEVTNNGSVPLHTISISDALPSCVERAGAVSVENAAGATVPSTSTGNIQVNVAPSAALAPGETFTITIPVRKIQGGNCCNVGVTATALMSTSGVELSANYGSEDEPAACVNSLECCDIPGFTAQLIAHNGTYYVQISGGAVPIQELDITMLDFHVSYNQEDCKPIDMGIFGMLSSGTTQVGGLTLQGNGPAGSLIWGLGNPSIINGQVAVEVSGPNVLDISCCEVTFTFCLKVRVKDVNCNVCEKTICYTGDPVKPCDLVITQMTDKEVFCPGDNIQLTWSGSTPSGLVDIYLVDAQTNTTYQVLASEVGGTNTFIYTIPADFPCDNNRIWYLVIKDPKSDCIVRTRRFRIICCTASCDCGYWKSHDVRVSTLLSGTPNDQFEGYLELAQKARTINTGQVVACGKSVKLKKGSYSFLAPDYICEPENCAVSYQWEVYGTTGMIVNGMGKTFQYQFVTPGIYKVVFTPICGGKKCEPCVIEVVIPGLIDEKVSFEGMSNL